MSVLSDIIAAVGGTSGLTDLAGGAVGIVEQLKNRGYTQDQINEAIDYAKSQTDNLLAAAGDQYTDTQNLANADLAGTTTLAGTLAQQARDRLQATTNDRVDWNTRDLRHIRELINRDEGNALGAIDSDKNNAIRRIDQLLSPVAFAAADDRNTAIKLGEESVGRGRTAVDQARTNLSPISRIASASARSTPITADELEGLLYSMALRGVGDTYDPLTESVTRQSLRSGADSTKQLEALARQRRDDTMAAAIESRIRGITGATDINNSRLGNAAQVAGGLEGELVNAEGVLKDIILGTQKQRQEATGQLGNIRATQGQLEDGVRSRSTELGTNVRQTNTGLRAQAGTNTMTLQNALTQNLLGGMQNVDKNQTALVGQAVGDLGASRRTAATNLSDAIRSAYTNNAAVQAGIAGAGYSNERRRDTPIGSLISGAGTVIGKIIDKIF